MPLTEAHVADLVAALTALHGFGPRTAATAWELWTAG